VRNGRVYVIDAGAYTSRLGPRLVTGLEIMAEIIHPEFFSGMVPPGSAMRI
jgi:iron complex transport system substrate-binding protein